MATWQQHRYEQQRIASAKRKHLAKLLNEIEEMKKKISLKERCSRTILDRLMKQVDENGKLITSLSEGNFELRKECSQKFNSDFDMYYEKFHYRPKAEILSLRGKNFEKIKADYLDQIGYLRNHSDRLKYLKKIKQEEIEKLQTKLAAPIVEKLDDSLVKKKMQLENDLDKLSQKNQLAKQINGLYKKISDQLNKDVVSFPNKLTDLQKQKKALEEEIETLQFYQNFALNEYEESMNQKLALETKVRQEKRLCNDSIANLEKIIRQSRPNEELLRSSDQLQKKNQIKKRSLKNFRSEKNASKEETAHGRISDYEKKANLLKCATGISFWDFKKMCWCLSNQMTISENLENQTKEKKAKIIELIAEKDKLNTVFEKLNYEKDTSYEETLADKEYSVEKLVEKVCALKTLDRDKGYVVDSAGQAFEYLVGFLVRKIVHYKINVSLPTPGTSNTEEEKLLNSLDLLQNLLYSLSNQAEEMLSRSPLKASEILKKAAVQSDHTASSDSYNNRIKWRQALETKPSEADYDFQGPDNDEYVSRKKLLRRAQLAVRGNRRKVL